MYVAMRTRNKTSEICGRTGRYEFDGYLDGSSEQLPALEEMEIYLYAGEVFPMITKQWRACFWVLSDSPAATDDPAAWEAADV